MHLTLDASALLNASETGGARYARQLIKHLLRNHTENTYTLFFYVFRKSEHLLYAQKSAEWRNLPNVKCRPIYLPRRFFNTLWRHAPFLLPIESLIDKSDLFHSLDCMAPLSAKMPVIATIYDLTLLKYPAQDPAKSVLFEKLIKQSVKRSHHIIAISNNTKQDLIDILQVPEKNISVTYLGVDEKFTPVSDSSAVNAVLARHGITKPYLLYVGTMGANKNIDTLIDSYAEAKRRHGFEHKLVICGKKTRLYPQFQKQIKDLKLENDVIMTGYIPDEDLPYIYGGAEMFLYLSHYEGFGIPVLEAMSCGCPVIASSNSSIPEITGNTGILVHPGNREEISEAITSLLSDGGRRKQLAFEARERSRQFSFEKCARETMNIYKGIIE